MNCPLKAKDSITDEALLLAYAAKRLDSPTAAILERHMQQCPECTTFRVQQANIWDLMDGWEQAPVSVDFNRRLWQRIDAAEAAPWYRRLSESLRMANWKPAFPLAAALVVIGAGFMLDHQGPMKPAPATSSITVSAGEAEQVEQTLEDLQLLHQFDSATVSKALRQM